MILGVKVFVNGEYQFRTSILVSMTFTLSMDVAFPIVTKLVWSSGPKIASIDYCTEIVPYHSEQPAQPRIFHRAVLSLSLLVKYFVYVHNVVNVLGILHVSTGNSRRHILRTRNSTGSTEPTKLSVQEGESWSWSQKKLIIFNVSSPVEDWWWISMQLTSEVVGCFLQSVFFLWFSPFAEHSLQFTDTLSHIGVTIVLCLGLEIGGTDGGGDPVPDELGSALHHVPDRLFWGVLVLLVRGWTSAPCGLRVL